MLASCDGMPVDFLEGVVLYAWARLGENQIKSEYKYIDTLRVSEGV